MTKFSPLPLRVVINRVGEPTPAQYSASRTPVDSAEAAYRFWLDVVASAPDFEPEKEHLVAILLDTKLRPMAFHLVSTGSLNETIAHPREIFRPAIILAAYGVILAHNHPSGDSAPSQADHRMTRQMSEAARLLQIQLLDHVVTGDAEGGRQPYFSFREARCL
ncbi:MAG: JAB domain-containing protein [Chthoniobacterales bacterium]|nr:JAB domain-containing protein [Chthoniobacterales bacterium]